MLGNSDLDTIGAFVSDYGRSLDFYKNTLGLQPVWEDPISGNASFRVGFNLLVLHLSPNTSQEKAGFILYFTSPDLQGTRQKLIKAGVECSEIQDAGEFRLVHFSDPDGNRLGLFEPTADYIPTLKRYLGREIRARQVGQDPGRSLSNSNG